MDAKDTALHCITHNDWKVNWKFYVDESKPYSIAYFVDHANEILHGDCHAVFRLNCQDECDWYGYSSDDKDDTRRNLLIDHPEYLLKKARQIGHKIYMTMGWKTFRFLTIEKKYDSPPFYEIVDYEQDS